MRSKLSVKIAAAVLAFAFAVYGVACSGQDNADDRAGRKLETNPDSGELVDAGAEAGAVLRYEDRTEIFPDSPPNPATCSVEEGVELATFVDFEGGAPTWFKFDDGTAPLGQGLLPLEGNQAATIPNWGLASVSLDPERCGSKDALHIQGGPFSNWGGGLGSQYFRLTGELAAENDQPESTINLYSPIATVPTDPDNVQGRGVDASAFQGVALWARRGQNSQSSFRLILNDKYTSNEAARLQYNRQQGAPGFANVPEGGPYCGRIRACVPAGDTCANGKVCNLWPGNNEWYCFNPDEGDTIEIATPTCDPEGAPCDDPNKSCNQWPVDNQFYCFNPENGETVGIATPRCDTTSCTSTNDVDCESNGTDVVCNTVATGAVDTSLPEDVLFQSKPCTPHTFSDNFLQPVCYDPETDPVPPNENERCDNGWTAMISVTSNWGFYRIPWSEFAQNDTLAVAPDFAFDSIYSINIGFSQGPVDFYIDDISFYR